MYYPLNKDHCLNTPSLIPKLSPDFVNPFAVFCLLYDFCAMFTVFAVFAMAVD